MSSTSLGSSDLVPSYPNRLATAGKSRAEKLRIYEREYREKLSLAAQRLINLDILPFLKKNGVEIYTVGLSPEADKAFLRHLADK